MARDLASCPRPFLPASRGCPLTDAGPIVEIRHAPFIYNIFVQRATTSRDNNAGLLNNRIVATFILAMQRVGGIRLAKQQRSGESFTVDKFHASLNSFFPPRGNRVPTPHPVPGRSRIRTISRVESSRNRRVLFGNARHELCTFPPSRSPPLLDRFVCRLLVDLRFRASDAMTRVFSRLETFLNALTASRENIFEIVLVCE